MLKYGRPSSMFTCVLIMGLAVGLIVSKPVYGRDSFLQQWRLVYPDSHSSRRGCQLCHANPNGGQPWNGYGFDIRTRYIEINRSDMRAAIVDTESQNSDSDANSLSNLSEINDNLDPGWRAPERNFVLYADMRFDNVDSPFNDTDQFSPLVPSDFCFVITAPTRQRSITVCL